MTCCSHCPSQVIGFFAAWVVAKVFLIDVRRTAPHRPPAYTMH